MKLILLSFVLLSARVFAIGCDCEVRVYSPTTGSHRMPATSLKIYELEEYSTYSIKNQRECRRLCLAEFEKDMPQARLNALLLTYSQSLIDEKVLCYNCTGRTTLKYPVRVKASLGNLGLGNVANLVQVVSHEELCF